MGEEVSKGKGGHSRHWTAMPAFFQRNERKTLGSRGDFSLFQERLTAQARNCLGGQACNEPLPTGGKRLPILFRHAEAALTF